MNAEDARQATAPARWLLDTVREGIALTEKHALARIIVHQAAALWPGW